MKRLFSVLLMAVVMATAFMPVKAGAVYNEYLENDLYSECALLLCTDNDEVIFSKSPNMQTKPASLTKVITATVVLNECKNLDEVYTVPESCITELMGTGSSLSGLKAGEEMSIYNLLCCLLIQSANDAATTLATYVTGSDRQAFIDKMNALAEELGCTNSHFMNVHGLDDDDQYTTVTDMATFFRNAMKNPTFAEIAGKAKYTLPETNMHKEREIRTTNFTLNSGYKDYYCEYEIAGKTGSTSGAGHCLVSAATNNGYNYIAVAMNAVKEDLDGDYVDENGAFVDVKAMYDWAFDNLRLVPIASSAKIVGEVPVKYGKSADYVTLCPSENSFGLMPKGVDEAGLLIEIDEGSIPKVVKAPLKKGDVICKGKVYYANEVVAEVDLVASSEVRRSFASYFGTIAEDIVYSAQFKAIAICVVAALIVFIVIGKRLKGKQGARTYQPVKYRDIMGEENKDNRQ